MWVVNPSEEEEKWVINLRNTVPGAMSGGQLARCSLPPHLRGHAELDWTQWVGE